jgi:hypothetical protein
MVRIIMAALVVACPVALFSGDTCPRIDKNNMWCTWEGWSGDDIRYFCMDFSDQRAPVLAIAHWHDTSCVSLFRLVQKQMKRGSIVLFFQSMTRNSNDKIIINGKGTVCETHGTIRADIQLFFKRNIFNDKLTIDFHKCSEKKTRSVDVLVRLARDCQIRIRSVKKK